MTTAEALAFLEKNQPLLFADQREEEDALVYFDQVLEHFKKISDPRCVPLILGFFGEGDGHGVYQLADDAITNQEESVAIPAICDALRSPFESVRFWTANIAMRYSDSRLARPLLELYKVGDSDEKGAAMTALIQSATEDIKSEVAQLVARESDPEVKGLMLEVLAKA